jgi:hypothetical protein
VSADGLLGANAVLNRPDLFGAAVHDVSPFDLIGMARSSTGARNLGVRMGLDRGWIAQGARDARHFELYAVAKLLPDLKYLGTPPKRPRGSGLGWVYPNDYWIGLFRSMRMWLGHPSPHHIDIVALHLERPELPTVARWFLSQLDT